MKKIALGFWFLLHGRLCDAFRRLICPLSAKAVCQKPSSPLQVRHVVLLSGPRHGTSFVMSILADSPRTLYLGEIFNSNTPMAHANFVDPGTTIKVMRSLDKELPKLNWNENSQPRLSQLKGLQANLGPRIAFNITKTRNVLEQWAVKHGYHTILYKLFGRAGYVDQLKCERCAHFLHLRRNFLQVQFSLLEISMGEGKFIGSESRDILNFNVTELRRELLSSMKVEMNFKRASFGTGGANTYIQYEELLAIEDKVAMNHSSMAMSLRDVKHFLTDSLDKSALDAATERQGALGYSMLDEAHVLCPYRLSRSTMSLYTRQDKRATLESKVGNYAELNESWNSICVGVAFELNQKDPQKTCEELAWSLPE